MRTGDLHGKYRIPESLFVGQPALHVLLDEVVRDNQRA